MRGSRIAATLVAVLALCSPVLGQQPLRIEVTPVVGAQFFAVDLPSSFTLDRTDGTYTRVQNMQLSTAATYGGHLGVRVVDRLGIEGNIMYAPATLSSEPGTMPDIDMTLITYGGSVSLLLPRPIERVEPFVVAGMGAKRYDYDVDTYEPQTELMWNFGCGTVVSLRPSLGLYVEARDYMSRFQSGVASVSERTQNDFVFAAGLRFTIGGDRTAVAVR